MLQMSNIIHSTVSYKFIRLVFPGKGLQHDGCPLLNGDEMFIALLFPNIFHASI